MHACMHVCMYLNIYTYIYTNICIYIYIHIWYNITSLRRSVNFLGSDSAANAGFKLWLWQTYLAFFSSCSQPSPRMCIDAKFFNASMLPDCVYAWTCAFVYQYLQNVHKYAQSNLTMFASVPRCKSAKPACICTYIHMHKYDMYTCMQATYTRINAPLQSTNAYQRVYMHMYTHINLPVQPAGMYTCMRAT